MFKSSCNSETPVFCLFTYLCCSALCFRQGVVSSARSASPLPQSSHMVALVSFPPKAGGRRGLTIVTDVSQETSPLVTVAGWDMLVNFTFNQCYNSAQPDWSTTPSSPIVMVSQVRRRRPLSRPPSLCTHWWPNTGSQWYPCPQHFSRRGMS